MYLDIGSPERVPSPELSQVIPPPKKSKQVDTNVVPSSQASSGSKTLAALPDIPLAEKKKRKFRKSIFINWRGIDKIKLIADHSNLILSVILGLSFYLLISYLIKALQLKDINLKY